MDVKNKKIYLAILGVITLVGLMWYFSTIVLYILISALLAIIGRPVVVGIEKIRIKGWKPSRGISATIALGVIISLFTVMVMSLTPIIASQLSRLSSHNMSEATSLIEGPIKEIEHSINASFPNSNFTVAGFIENQMEGVVRHDLVSNTIGTITSMASSVMMGIFCVSFITFFFLQDEKMFSSWVKMLFSKKHSHNVEHALGSINKLLRRYFVGLFAESLIKFVFISIALYILGFPLDMSMLMAMVTAVLNVIPYVGPIIGGVIALGIAALNPIAGSDQIEVFGWIGVILLVFQLFDNIILQPYIYASSVKAHPLEIFIVILMAGYMAGVLGMLFAIPIYTVIRVFAREFFSKYKLVETLTESISKEALES